MEYKFKCGENEFSVKLPKIKESGSIKALEDWAKLINEVENKEDRWDKVSPFPFEFKNLRIITDDFDISEENYDVTVTLIYDTVTLDGEEVNLPNIVE